ncbi:class I SAM-dependent DNA methyltransferase [Desulfoprunum benzoelyticum]|uniref:site-specific DNA-methyltransferase (adenine-specific) n=1 Tax=Desulfoprunum benzoelyticum TaxID=1506996 RepID=A0A840UXU5_9BACT|nr:DNA methyltransferase [Desulfoprunum benzoelyticum]MBB5348274.1 type II restriction/modification system DNA methylase subunit YeeA [Desulfoprunum benzoelyticum]MBM9529535.1 class I SAM-dependent DNA methyltransferase [Desulfoprunum benzoelyticum]
MTPDKFIATWQNNPLTERAGAQAHFDDLCDLLGVEKPRDPENYCFERGAKKAGGGDGWADVWKRGCFGWENKKPGRDLDSALKQLTDYSLHLDNPPLLVVSDRERIIIHTAFTGYPDQPKKILIEDLKEESVREMLRWVFEDPGKLRPEKSTAAITGEAAGQFADLAKAMRGRGIDGQQTAHFLVQCLFCMFAEDEGLLPGQVFTNILENAASDPAKASGRIEKLFSAMADPGGEYGDHDIPWFNGGLFAMIAIPTLASGDIKALRSAAQMDWLAIDPTIFGTLFERSLDPAARAPLGAHYTDTATIRKLITPLITEPLLAQWEQAGKIIATGAGKGPKTKARKDGDAAWQEFTAKLQSFRVLDPACGSGNFLYLALEALRDVERRVFREANELAGHQQGLWLLTGPHNILGIEINEYAAELARTTVWIGDIQWRRRNGRPINNRPILSPLDGIEHRDALLTEDGQEAEWPNADVIVGNPPFLGDKMMRKELGDLYVETLRKRYEGRVPGGADLVTYWFEKARAQIEAGMASAAGLVATNSIRQKRNRVVLERILASTRIFEAWSDEEWVNEGAAVRVSLVCFGQGDKTRLDGKDVAVIHADLTGSGQEGQALDLTQAEPLAANKSRSFFGLCLAGPFKVDTPTALTWLQDTGNPNGRPNSDVVRPIYNGSDITRRWAGNWVVDFSALEQNEAADYLVPFAYVEEMVKPVRISNNRPARAKKWWHHGEKRPGMRIALSDLTHFIATPETAKHRFFVKFAVQVAPEHSLIVIPRQDDTTLGILSSRIHCIWSLAKGGRMGMGNDPRYNASLTFETFPFPSGFDLAEIEPPQIQVFQDIAAAANDLNDWREKWLNPDGWLTWEITPEEQAAGFPPRPIPTPDHATEWKKRTLTNLYNLMPSGLKLRQEHLDNTVAAAYGWDDYTPAMPDATLLKRLLSLNLERARH